MGLGDAVSEALAAVGITPEAVTRWLGAECGCEERKAKLNAIGAWASRVASGKVTGARGYLLGILGGSGEDAGSSDGSPTDRRSLG